MSTLAMTVRDSEVNNVKDGLALSHQGPRKVPEPCSCGSDATLETFYVGSTQTLRVQTHCTQVSPSVHGYPLVFIASPTERNIKGETNRPSDVSLPQLLDLVEHLEHPHCSTWCW